MRAAHFTSRSGRRRRLGAAAALASVPFAISACGEDKADATASFRSPEDGANVAGMLAVDMVADGVTIEAAGEEHDGFGHFHVIVDDGCVSTGTAVPKDARHVHFGSGATTGAIYLEPGEHELCLQIGDGVHSALDVTDTVTVTVGVTTQEQWCDVVADVDEMFTQADSDGEDFAVRQVTYGNIVRLIAQLTDGIDVVAEGVRDDVTAAIATGSQIAAAFADAPDESAAGVALEEIFGAEGADAMAEAAPWINETCGVDIDG